MSELWRAGPRVADAVLALWVLQAKQARRAMKPLAVMLAMVALVAVPVACALAVVAAHLPQLTH